MTLRPGSIPAGQRRSLPSPLPAAVLWDMDGTLVDTEPCWLAVEATLVEEHGGTWTSADALQMIGLPLPDASRILQAHGVALPVEEIGERLVDGVIEAVGEHVEWQPGALELLGDLRAAGVPCALVTMSYRRFTDAVLVHAPTGAFDVVVTGDEVTRGKPDPEPYLRAAALLGVEIGDCLAIEDSPPGVTSALASGARTLGVQHIAAVEPQPGLSRAGSLADIGLTEVTRMASGEVLDLLGVTTP